MAEQEPEYTALCTNVAFDFVGTKIAQKTLRLNWDGGPLVTFVLKCSLLFLMCNANVNLDTSACTGSTAPTPTRVMEVSKTGLSLLILAALIMVV